MESKNKKLLIVLAAVVLIILVAWMWRNSKRDVDFNLVNLEKAEGVEKLPEGLPEGLPVELDTAVQSFTAERKDDTAVQSTFSYMSSKLPQEVYAQYKNYLKTKGYQLISESYTSAIGGSSSMYGVKDGDDLYVLIIQEGEGSRVEVSYINR